MRVAVVRMLVFCLGLSLSALVVAGEPAADSKAPASGKGFPVVNRADDSPLPAKADTGDPKPAPKPGKVAKLGNGGDEPAPKKDGGAKGLELLLKSAGVQYQKNDQGGYDVTQEVDGQQIAVAVQQLNKSDLGGRPAIWVWAQLTPNKPKDYKIPDEMGKHLTALCDPANDKTGFGVQFGGVSLAAVKDDKGNVTAGEVAYLNYYLPLATADSDLVKDYIDLCARKTAQLTKELGGTVEKSRGPRHRR